MEYDWIELNHKETGDYYQSVCGQIGLVREGGAAGHDLLVGLVLRVNLTLFVTLSVRGSRRSGSQQFRALISQSMEVPL